jgi:transmembrane 9 superfamily member 1
LVIDHKFDSISIFTTCFRCYNTGKSLLTIQIFLTFVKKNFLLKSRVLRNDFMRYNSEGDDILEDEDYGWKLISNDVFRFPPNKGLFCAVLGVGSQFLAMIIGILFMALVGLFNVHRHGSLNTAAFLLYALTSCISGYVSAKNYKQMNGEKWVWNINLTASLFTIPFFLTWAVINSVAWAHSSTQALPFTTIIILGLIWIVIGYPLTIIGGIFGKNTAHSFDAPCRTKNISREIPPIAWYRTIWAHIAIGGFLPFSAISVELYYIFSTLWGRDQYTLYGILAVVFFILLSVTACISVSLTYFQLAAEDYRWWWRSIFISG